MRNWFRNVILYRYRAYFVGSPICQESRDEGTGAQEECLNEIRSRNFQGIGEGGLDEIVDEPWASILKVDKDETSSVQSWSSTEAEIIETKAVIEPNADTSSRTKLWLDLSQIKLSKGHKQSDYVQGEGLPSPSKDFGFSYESFAVLESMQRNYWILPNLRKTLVLKASKDDMKTRFIKPETTETCPLDIGVEEQCSMDLQGAPDKLASWKIFGQGIQNFKILGKNLKKNFFVLVQCFPWPLRTKSQAQGPFCGTV